jgi:hypothetical protein
VRAGGDLREPPIRIEDRVLAQGGTFRADAHGLRVDLPCAL